MFTRTIYLSNQAYKEITVCVFQRLEFIGEQPAIIPIAYGTCRLSRQSHWRIEIPDEQYIVAGNMSNGMYEKKTAEPIGANPDRRSFQLKKNPDGSMEFSPSIHYAPQEHVCIQAVGRVPLNGSALGIGVGDAATCVFNIRNDMDYQFRATPQLYVAFSDEIREGQAIDPQTPFVPVSFTENNNTMYISFRADGTYWISDRLNM